MTDPRWPQLAGRPPRAVAIGASAGGIEALLRLLEPLPSNTRVPVVAVLHLPPTRESHLASLFAARLALKVEEARPGLALEPGYLYFAPPDYHLQVEPDHTFSLSCDPPVNFSRPSIDVLLESCAHAYGPELAAFVLTGANDDGARGLARVREAGGLALVQEPADAAHGAMPEAAISIAGADLVLPLADVRDVLLELISP